MKKFFYWLLIAGLFVIIAVEAYDKHKYLHPSEVEVVDSTTTVEENADTAPQCRDSVVIRYQYVSIPIKPPPEGATARNDSLMPEEKVVREISVVNVTDDSVAVTIPISQRLYETEDYRAYVSGYNATLDSIFVTSKNTVVRIRDPVKRKRFSVGLQAGYGMTPKGFQPYVGIGVSVNLFSF